MRIVIEDQCQAFLDEIQEGVFFLGVRVVEPAFAETGTSKVISMPLAIGLDEIGIHQAQHRDKFLGTATQPKLGAVLLGVEIVVEPEVMFRPVPDGADARGRSWGDHDFLNRRFHRSGKGLQVAD
jgi:hypothetical protein